MSDSMAKDWLSSHKRPLPAIDILRQKALSTLKRSTASLSDLADVISLDPGMSITLFEKMNAKRNDIKRPYINSIHGLLGLMGIPAVTQFIEAFDSFERSEVNSDIHQAYQQLVSRNFHLMRQSSVLIRLQGMDYTAETQAAALLYNVAEIYTCLFDFQRYQKYQQASLLNKVTWEQVESIFGFNFAELGLLLSHELHFPNLACESQQLSKSNYRTARTIQIAAEITQQAEAGWDHDALMQSLNCGAEYFDYPVANLRKKVFSAALEAAVNFPIHDVFPAIAKAILLPSVVKQKIEVKKKQPILANLSFAEKVKLLMELPATNPTAIIKLLIKELAEEQQLCRIVFMLLSNDGNALSTEMSQGLSSESPLLKLQIKLTNDGLLKKLIVKPQSLWVKPENFKQYEPLLPVNFKVSCKSQDFFLMSLFAGEDLIGIFFYDSNNSLDEGLYKTFKSNLLMAGMALTFLSQRANNPNLTRSIVN